MNVLCRDTAWTYCLHKDGCPDGRCEKREQFDARGKAMTDRERLDQIANLVDALQRDHIVSWTLATTEETAWLVALARRLLAVEEAARKRGVGAYAGLCAALADLDEWRKEQQ